MAILAIDAAWTMTEPSGVALVKEEGDVFVCQAVAPSYESFIRLADGKAIDWNAQNFRGSVPDIDQLLIAAHKICSQQVNLSAVDMPLSTVPITCRRIADSCVSREFGGRWCSAHSPNISRPGTLGENLAKEFHKAGYPLITASENNIPIGALIEVYPHPSLLSLLDREKRIPYKISKSNKYWPKALKSTRIDNLLIEFNAIYSALTIVFGTLPFALPVSANGVTLASLKRYEDCLDALVCAWTGMMFLRGMTVPLGDSTSAIWCPKDVVRNH